MPPTKKAAPEAVSGPVVSLTEPTEPAEPEVLAEDAQEPELDEAPAAERMFISAGVASDLDMRGWAGDPATGGIFRRDEETGEVTFTPRDGEPRAVEI